MICFLKGIICGLGKFLNGARLMDTSHPAPAEYFAMAEYFVPKVAFLLTEQSRLGRRWTLQIVTFLRLLGTTRAFGVQEDTN